VPQGLICSSLPGLFQHQKVRDGYLVQVAIGWITNDPENRAVEYRTLSFVCSALGLSWLVPKDSWSSYHPTENDRVIKEIGGGKGSQRIIV